MAKKATKRELMRKLKKLERNKIVNKAAQKTYIRPAEFALPEEDKE